MIKDFFRRQDGKFDKPKLMAYLQSLPYIEQVKFLVENFEDNFPRMIKSIDYLNRYVNEQTKDLSDPFYKMSTKLFWIFNGIKSWNDTRVQCKICHKPLKNKNIQLYQKAYPLYCCRKCQSSDPDVRAKYRQTCIKHFGVDHNMKTKESKEKRVKTWLKTLGVTHPSKSLDVIKKIKQTNLLRHNVEWWNNREKIKQTVQKLYGVDYPFQNSEIQKKCQESQLKNNGHINPAHGKGAQEKIQKTMLERYNSIRAPQWKYIYNNETYDSSWEIYFAEYCKQHGINITHNNKIFFTYIYNGKQYKYFPDFIFNNTTFFEIKGDHFFKNKDINNQMICPWNSALNDQFEAKHQCMINNGVFILTSFIVKQIIKEIQQKFGKNWIKQFKVLNH